MRNSVTLNAISGNSTAISTTAPIASVEAPGRWITLQLSGTFVGTVLFEQSNDNVTWYALPLTSAIVTVFTAPVITATAVGMWQGPVVGKYVRVRTSAYTSGTITATAAFSVEPTGALIPPNAPAVTGTVTANTGSPITTSIAAGSSAIANGTVLTNVGAKSKHTMVIVLSAGTASAGTVQLQGALDGVNWYPLGAPQSPTVASSVNPTHVVDANAIQVRAAITVAFVGATITVQIASSN